MGYYLAFAVSPEKIGKLHLFTTIIELILSFSGHSRGYSTIHSKIYLNRRKFMLNQLHHYCRFNHLVILIMRSKEKTWKIYQM